MADRDIDPRIQKIKDDGFTVWSYSRINTASGDDGKEDCAVGEGCFWAYYQQYIAKVETQNSIYGLLGGKAHDCLESFYGGKIGFKQMYEEMSLGIQEVKLLGYRFPMGDSEEKNWTESTLHFMKTHNVLKYEKVLLEVLVLVKLSNDIYIQGYVDAVFVDKDGGVHIYDWKTSSKTNFGKDKILKTGRQLVFYKIAIELMSNKKVVETAWNMLKFCEIHYINGFKKNGEPKYSKLTVMRNKVEENIIGKLGQLLEPHEFMIGQMSYINGSLDFSCFPKYDIFKFEIKDHFIQYEVTPELEKECLDFFEKVVRKIESKDKNNISDWLYYSSNFVKDGVMPHFCTTLCNVKNSCPQFNAWKTSLELTGETIY